MMRTKRAWKRHHLLRQARFEAVPSVSNFRPFSLTTDYLLQAKQTPAKQTPSKQKAPAQNGKSPKPNSPAQKQVKIS